ncbi:YgcG family protein [Stagnimonas aquatica]|uniref:YgcG family protein n=1 Tax=Stagnimonas aquatica TaxID=2689987 RepID=A0A3N0VNM8_9GAMM|nr:YgcG family protein [Stagnimonas aquatica]ROH93588.1 YgcG family protein [Stagnimonas aquatica]
MNLRRLRLGALAALGLLVGALAHAELPVPELPARVTDQTGTLDATQRGALEQKLAAFEQSKGSQIAVLIVTSTAPETIEQYSLRVAEKWKLGRKGVDDGALLLIAKNDRTLRIEVGYGLEGALPDAIAKRIVAETITPYFQQGDFYGGIDAGTSQMIQVIDGEPLPAPKPARGGNGSQADRLIGSLLLPFMVLYAIGQGLRRLIGSFPASALVGGGTGIAAFLILGSGLVGLGVALFAMIAALVLYSGALGGVPIHGGYGGGRGGGFGGGGGGFSGGGGGFGGGGASGRW